MPGSCVDSKAESQHALESAAPTATSLGTIRDKYEQEIYLKCKADPNARPVTSLHDYGTGWEITSLKMTKQFYAEDNESIYRAVLGYVPLANVVKGCAPFNVVLWVYSLKPEDIFWTSAKQRWTHLHVAGRNGAAYLIPWLYETNPSAADMKDTQGRTPLDVAIEEDIWWKANPDKCIGCDHYARTYNIATATEPLYCIACAHEKDEKDIKDGIRAEGQEMVDIVNMVCIKCKKRTANFNVLTDPVSRYCGVCSTPDMYNLVIHKCIPNSDKCVQLLREIKTSRDKGQKEHLNRLRATAMSCKLKHYADLVF